MIKDREQMIVIPHEKGGYCVRPMSWSGVWNEKGQLEAGCNFTAIFSDNPEAEEYCRICNEPLRTAIIYLRESILKDECLRNGFISSISSALKENIMPFAPEEEVAERVLDYIVGEKPQKVSCFPKKFELKEEDRKRLEELMVNSTDTVDITGQSHDIVLSLVANVGGIRKLITRDPEHYEYLETSKGFRCVAGGPDKLYGIPLILDFRGKIRATKIESVQEGEEHDN